MGSFFQLPELGKWVGLAGGRRKPGPVEEVLEKLRVADGRWGTTTQAFDARRVAGRVHLAHAARLALLFHSRGSGFADSLAAELVCWTAADRQIRRALERVGLREDSRTVALVSVGERRESVEGALGEIFGTGVVRREDGVMELSPSKRKALLEAFSLSPSLVRKMGLERLVLEKVALLALER